MLNKMLMVMMVILMTIDITFTKGTVTQDGCTHGNVRLVHGNVLKSRGIVEICINSRWGRVSRDDWGDNDAAVVCRQLGYGAEGKCLP